VEIESATAAPATEPAPAAAAPGFPKPGDSQA
jgi:hypothetical protein